MAMRQRMPGRQAACMCVSVDSSHANCPYHIHKYSCNFNGIQRPFPFLHESCGGIWGGGGRLIFRVDLYSGKYGMSRIHPVVICVYASWGTSLLMDVGIEDWLFSLPLLIAAPGSSSNKTPVPGQARKPSRKKLSEEEVLTRLREFTSPSGASLAWVW